MEVLTMESLLAQITNYLLAQSWQIALLIIVVALISFLLRNKSAHIRYILWLIVLAKCLVPPLYTIPVAILPEQQKPAYTSEPSIAERLITEYTVPEVAVAESPRPISIRPETISSPTITEKQARYDTQALLVIGWLVGVVTLILYYFINALRTQIWLHKRRKKVPREYKKNIESLFNTHGIRRIPNIWLLDKVSQPFVWGLIRGSIYLPTKMLVSSHTKFQASLLGHELSHVIRLDAMINSLQVVTQAIFWFHPLVWWANKKIRAEREKCCDEMTIARLNTLPEDYSEAIVETLAAKNESARPVPSLAVAGQVKNIEERIKTMLRPGKKFYKRPSVIALTIVLLLAFMIVPIGCVLTNRQEAKKLTYQEERYLSLSLFEAIEAGDLVRVKRLIAEGADVNTKGRLDWTVLFEAVSAGRIDIAELLIDKGADVNASGEQLFTPLYYAIWNNDKDMVSLLINKGADVNFKVKEDYTPIYHAVFENNLDIVKLLVENGAKFDEKVLVDKMTALHYAAQLENRDIVEFFIHNGVDNSSFYMTAYMGDMSRIKELVENGTDIDKKDEAGWTPLYWAVSGGQGEIAKFLIDNGADIDADDGNGQSLLHQAARSGSPQLVELLISKGGDVNAKIQSGNQGGYTPLHNAALSNNVEVAELLISKGADVNAESNNPITRHTPLHVAATHGAEMVELLIDKGANINASSGRYGRTPLHQAITAGKNDIVELLIDKGADINAKVRMRTPGMTPLHLAIENGDKDLTELLISKGADINAKMNDGCTAIYNATKAGRKDIVELLISKGADINISNNLGLTPLYIAEHKGYTRIAELLIENDAKAISPSLRGAITIGDLERVKVLISQSADVNSQKILANRFLHLACENGYKEIVELLIDKGADINAENNIGQTPLDRAELFNKAETAKLLINHGAKRGLFSSVSSGDTEEVKRRISQGAEVNAIRIGQSLLHIACQSGNKKIVELLINSGADVNVSNRRGLTPLDIAERDGQTEIIELLRVQGAKKGFSNLLRAINSGDIEQVKLLISQGADVNTKNNAGQTLLHIACRSGNKEVVEFLIDQGANINSKSNRDLTPLDLAQRAGHTEIVELLKKHGAKE